MSRCGCSSQCSCVVTGTGGIAVSGNGSPARPYVVMPVGNDPAWTAAVATALVDIAGPGLIYTPASGKMQVRISTDEGNTISFGSDGGLFDTGGGGPAPESGVTVAGLPATGVAGSWGVGAGYLIAPDGMLQSFEQAVALDLDITSTWARSLGDETLVAAPSTDMTQYVTPKGDRETWLTDISDANLGRFKRMYIDAGNQDDTVSGWWGWSAVDTYGMCSIADVFRICGRRTVLSVMPGDAGAWTNLLDDILRYGLTKSVLVTQYGDATTQTVEALANFAQYKNATVACMQYVSTDAVAAVLTADALKAAGVGWVLADTAVTDPVLTAYKTAGLNVLLRTHSHHFETLRAATLGIRGVLAEDPVYASNVPARYQRKGAQSSQNGSRAWWYGMLSPNTWAGARWSGKDMNQAYRGYFGAWPVADNGFYLPRGTGNTEFGVLLGCIAPPNPQRYTFTIGCRFYELPSDTQRWVGAAFSCPDDIPWNSSTSAPGLNSGYAFGLRANGKLAAWKRNPNVTYAEVATGLTIRTGTTYTVTVAVDPDKIVLTCNGKSLTIADTTFRGKYAHVLKHEGTSPFRGGFASWGYA